MTDAPTSFGAPPVRPLRLALVCFPTLGGSGVVATELAVALAARGHRVHLIARARPERLDDAPHRVLFHRATESDYPALEGSSAYPIALASRIVDVQRAEALDVVHVHYAVPHATSAWLARLVLGDGAPKFVTTLHGTDATIVGTDPRHLPITRPAVEASDAITVPSEALRRAAVQRLGIAQPIEVLPNFVDARRFAPGGDRAALRAYAPDLADDEAVLIHVSNFRPVKRTLDVVRVAAAVAKARPARLFMIGDGPDRAAAEHEATTLGVRAAFVGRQCDFRAALGASDVFLLPSEAESFGLAALEAQSSGVPVVASDAGGIPEVVVHGETGLLAPVGDVGAMAAHVLALLADPARRRETAARARVRVLERFDEGPAIDRWEALYRRVTSSAQQRPASSSSSRRAPSRRRP